MEIDNHNILREITILDFDKEKEGKIVIPEGVIAIGEGVFQYNEYLKEIVLPQSLKEIHARAFDFCANLTKVNCKVSPRNPKKFINTFPKNLEYISENAFRGCEKLGTFTLPDSVRTIRNHAFFGCSRIKSFKYPKSLKYFGDDVFNDCLSLKVVYLPDEIEINDSLLRKLPNTWIVQKDDKFYNHKKYKTRN